jgi:hypothetical protein
LEETNSILCCPTGFQYPFNYLFPAKNREGKLKAGAGTAARERSAIGCCGAAAEQAASSDKENRGGQSRDQEETTSHEGSLD